MDSERRAQELAQEAEALFVRYERKSEEDNGGMYSELTVIPWDACNVFCDRLIDLLEDGVRELEEAEEAGAFVHAFRFTAGVFERLTHTAVDEEGWSDDLRSTFAGLWDGLLEDCLPEEEEDLRREMRQWLLENRDDEGFTIGLNGFLSDFCEDTFAQ